MVEAQTRENTAIEPSPGQSDTPLMGNPILIRGNGGRPRRGKGAKTGGQIVLPAIAIVGIAGAAAAYFLFMAPQNRPLMTNPPAASASSAPTEANEPPTAQASTAAPTDAPAAPAKPAPPTAARETAKPADPAARLARAERGLSRAPPHIAASRARAADEAGADASATAPAAAPVAPSQHAPSPPQVIAPPPAQ